VSLWKKALGFAATAYYQDVIVRPQQVARLARAYCDRVGKPLLNVGAGTRRSSLRAALFGPLLVGDVNIDVAAPRRPHGARHVSYGDATNLREWPNKHFGAVFASHVLEHLDRPDLALAEMERVADKVFAVVPKWWAPHTWLHPGHKWYISEDLREAQPLWTGHVHNRLLKASDNAYGGERWNPRTSQPQSSPPSPPPNQSSRRGRRSPPPPQGGTREEPTSSSNSISTLMVVSARDK
jgi:SAM-dependent methyltransferase